MSPIVRTATIPATDESWPSLPPEERALLSPRAVDKRRREFIAGRLAARACLRAALGEDVAASARVVRETDGPTAGRPRIVDASGAWMRPWHLSISHAGPLAIAAVADGPLGIDVATVAPLDEAFLVDVFAPGELAAWEAIHATDRRLAVAAAFATKEAVLKWLGTGLRVPARGVDCRPCGADAVAVSGLVGARLAARWWRDGDEVVALVWSD